mgnify:FL=1
MASDGLTREQVRLILDRIEQEEYRCDRLGQHHQSQGLRIAALIIKANWRIREVPAQASVEANNDKPSTREGASRS